MWNKTVWTLRKRSQAPCMILTECWVPMGFPTCVRTEHECSKCSRQVNKLPERDLCFGRRCWHYLSLPWKRSKESLSGGIPTRMHGPLFAKGKLRTAVPTQTGCGLQAWGWASGRGWIWTSPWPSAPSPARVASWLPKRREVFRKKYYPEWLDPIFNRLRVNVMKISRTPRNCPKLQFLTHCRGSPQRSRPHKMNSAAPACA